jgi:hypothetical protein
MKPSMEGYLGQELSDPHVLAVVAAAELEMPCRCCFGLLAAFGSKVAL